MTSTEVQAPAPIHIALAIMVKDESKTIAKSIDSCLPHVHSIWIFDTGSTDDTLDIVRRYPNAHVNEGNTFIDFSASRNAMLDWVEESGPEVTHILLLDSNDELRGGEQLETIIRAVESNPQAVDISNRGYMLRQKWFFGGGTETYFNVRLIGARCKWRYHMKVHEYIACPTGVSQTAVKVDSALEIYQDRTKDCESSGVRFARDYKILRQELEERPTCSRTMFYLAQTCNCLGLVEEAYRYYRMRTHYGGFQEELLHSYMQCGDLSLRLGLEISTARSWWLRAVGHMMRVEPLIRLASSYIGEKPANYLMAYTFSNLAVSIDFPHHATLFVARHAYDYVRWHIHGIVCYYIGKYEEGMRACLNAIKAQPEDLDKSNLRFYEQALGLPITYPPPPDPEPTPTTAATATSPDPDTAKSTEPTSPDTSPDPEPTSPDTSPDPETAKPEH